MKNKFIHFINTFLLIGALLAPHLIFAAPSSGLVDINTGRPQIDSPKISEAIDWPILIWDSRTNSFVQPNDATMKELGEVADSDNFTIAYDAKATDTKIDKFLVISKDLINWSAGLILIFITMYVIVYGIQLASAGDNPSQRREILSRLLYSGIGLMILGGLWSIALLASTLF